MNSKLSCAPSPKGKRNTRINYLALDNSLVKTQRDCIPRTKFSLSKNGAWEIVPLDQTFPNALSASMQVVYSCSKIGTRLLNTDNTDFNLRDPFLHQSRFTVEYNPLHDPGLKTYLQSRPVRKTLLKKKIINSSGDVICTARDFFQYARYLEQRRTEKVMKELTERVRNIFVLFIRSVIIRALDFSVRSQTKTALH